MRIKKAHDKPGLNYKIKDENTNTNTTQTNVTVSFTVLNLILTHNGPHKGN